MPNKNLSIADDDLAVENRKELLDLLIDTSKIIRNGVMWLNANGHILSINNCLIEELGYQSGEYSPKTIFEINPTTSFLSWKKLWAQAQEKRVFEVKTEQLTSDNSIYPVNMRGILLNLHGYDVCMVITENLMTSNRYKNLLDITSEIVNVGSWEWDLVQDEILFSNQMYNILGINKAQNITHDFVSRMMQKIINDSDFESLSEDFTRVIKEGGKLEKEISLNINSVYGTYKLLVESDFLEDRTIKLYGTVQSMANMNKQVSSLFFTQYVMDNARDMILWTDEDGLFVYANKAACRTLGYTKEELIGQTPHLISPNYESNKRMHWNQLKEDVTIETKAIHRKKDGTLFPVSVIGNHLEFQGKTFACGFLRDLTNVNKRNEIIAIIEKSLDQSRDMVVSVAENGSFKYYNKPFLDILGYSADELSEMKVIDIFADTSKEVFEDEWTTLKNGNKLRDLDRKLNLKSGNIIPLEVSMDMVEIEDKFYSTIVMRDVTDKLLKHEERNAYIAQIEELQKDTHDHNIELKEEIERELNFSNIVTKDPNYRKILQQVDQVAETNATVLILGETGTGKELLARAIHQMSEREERPMIKINCGALPENLIESELFGHEKGSFTGAYKLKIGKFERADKGTIFLDEIGELSLDLQSKLLRVLQEGEIERVGGTELINLDVRVIAATNRNLEKRVNDGKFREDLYYRLNVFPIFNIPLRERPQDIPLLAEHFVRKHSNKIGKKINEISAKSLNNLIGYDFLGNVRELENIVERAVILCKGNVLSFDNQLLRSENTDKNKRFLTLEEAQKRHIVKALKRTKGRVSGENGAAALLQINGKTLSSRMRKLKIAKSDFS